jgi:hypothetical protein
MKVFISHSTKDLHLIDRFEQTIRAAGIQPYVASDDDQPGTLLWDKVKSNIKNSDCMLVVLTKNGSRSRWVQQEIAAADAMNIPVIPVAEKGVDLSGLLEGKQIIEFDRSDPSRAQDRVHLYLKGVKKKLDTQQLIGAGLLIGLALFFLSQSD